MGKPKNNLAAGAMAASAGRADNLVLLTEATLLLLMIKGLNELILFEVDILDAEKASVCENIAAMTATTINILIPLDIILSLSYSGKENCNDLLQIIVLFYQIQSLSHFYCSRTAEE
jgi:hypothetical protein